MVATKSTPLAAVAVALMGLPSDTVLSNRFSRLAANT